MAFFAERPSLPFSSITSLQLIKIKQCSLVTVPKQKLSAEAKWFSSISLHVKSLLKVPSKKSVKQVVRATLFRQTGIYN